MPKGNKTMIRQGEKITNVRTGQTMLFLKTAADTNGKLLQIECWSPPTGIKEPEHVHPYQESSFEMISGSCNFSINGKESIAGAGQKVNIPMNVPHYFWNSSSTEAHYIQEFRPALNIDSFFETFFTLARDGKLNNKGIPNLFQGSVIMLRHKDEIRVTKPLWALQYFTYITLAPFGRLMGYSSSYK